MKIAVGSDIHLEFGDLILKNTEGADVLVLAGDICVARHLRTERGDRYRDFFKRASFQFPTVLYVMGNHEHYSNKFEDTEMNLMTMVAPFENVHVLNRSTWSDGEVMFIGATLWTDMNDYDEFTMHAMRDYMTDYRAIRRDYTGKSGEHKFTPMFTVQQHDKDKSFIKSVASATPKEKIVVITHHAPSHKSIHEQYANDELLNGAFASSLEGMIADSRINLWIHGHMHNSFDYLIDNTRVVCNPRGYIGHEEHALHFELKYLEI